MATSINNQTLASYSSLQRSLVGAAVGGGVAAFLTRGESVSPAAKAGIVALCVLGGALLPRMWNSGENDNRKFDEPETGKQKNKHLFRFPKNYTIAINTGKKVDLSDLEVDLSDIFVGGIGHGGGGMASKLMARTMEAIGHGKAVYNLPFCIEGALDVPKGQGGVQMVSAENEVVFESEIQGVIATAIRNGFTHINIPIDLDGHATLVAVVISNGVASLRFYDSLSSDISSYEKRYNQELIAYIESLLPKSVSLTADKPKILHLLDQGGKDSMGCGYYALYTALFLKNNEIIKDLTSFGGKPLFNEADDKQIRADLVVRTLLTHGLEKVDTEITALMYRQTNHIFDRIKFEMSNLIPRLQERV